MEKKVAEEHTIWAKTIETLNSGMGEIKRNTEKMTDVGKSHRCGNDSHRRGRRTRNRLTDDADEGIEADDEGAASSLPVPDFRGSRDWTRLLVGFPASK